VLGVIITLPIGGADMPVVISLFNAFTGLAVGFEGYVLGIPALIIAGIVVGAAGTLLTQLMAKAMNRPITNILFSPITGEAQAGPGPIRHDEGSARAMDAASMMRYAQKVIIVPGYGMAVAGAQHKVWEMTKLLEEAGVEVKFAIHPVAGRMPGHMNVLLAEAGVPTTDLRPGRNQRRVRPGRRGAGHRGQRCGESDARTDKSARSTACPFSTPTRRRTSS
jgi:NAD(P) transhydrogenase subunit beta